MTIERRREIARKYNQSAKGKINQQKYRKLYPDRIKATQDKCNAKRSRFGQALQRLARMKGCTVCGTHEDILYHWHHLGKKNFDLSKGNEHSREQVRTELKLVQPMCMPCHMQMHRAAKKESRL